MIIARVESLILNKTINDALKRSESYLNAGADGIMIHSKDKSPKKIFQFSNKFRKKFNNIPLVVVPSSFNKVKEKELAMKKVAKEILKNGRSFESDNSLLSIKDILNLIPSTR